MPGSRLAAERLCTRRGGLPHAARALSRRRARLRRDLPRAPGRRGAHLGGPLHHARRPRAQGRHEPPARRRRSAPTPRPGCACAGGELSGIEAFSQRLLYARGNLDLAVGFEGLFRLPDGRPPLMRVHEVKTRGGPRLDADDGRGPRRPAHPRPRRREELVLRHRGGAEPATTRSTRSTCRASARPASPLTAPYNAKFFAQTVVDVMDELGIEPRPPRRQLDGRPGLDRGRAAPPRAGHGPGACCVRPSRSSSASSTRSCACCGPSSACCPTASRAGWSPGSSGRCSATPTPSTRAWPTSSVEEFQRIYGSAGARFAFLSAARNIYLDKPFGRGGFYPRLSELSAPSLFVWGTHDPLIPPGLQAPRGALAAAGRAGRPRELRARAAGRAPRGGQRAAAGLLRARGRGRQRPRAGPPRGVGVRPTPRRVAFGPWPAPPRARRQRTREGRRRPRAPLELPGGREAAAPTACRCPSGRCGALAKLVTSRIPAADLDDRDPDYIREKLPDALAARRASTSAARSAAWATCPRRARSCSSATTPAATSPWTPASSCSPSAPTSASSASLYTLAHNLVLSMPGLGFLRKFGVVAASPGNAEKALRVRRGRARVPGRRPGGPPPGLGAQHRRLRRPQGLDPPRARAGRADRPRRRRSAARRPRCSCRAARRWPSCCCSTARSA